VTARWRSSHSLTPRFCSKGGSITTILAMSPQGTSVADHHPAW
jgi:hypothetical protein